MVFKNLVCGTFVSLAKSPTLTFSHIGSSSGLGQPARKKHRQTADRIQKPVLSEVEGTEGRHLWSEALNPGPDTLAMSNAEAIEID
jgi:hypothetical protein